MICGVKRYCTTNPWWVVLILMQRSSDSELDPGSLPAHREAKLRRRAEILMPALHYERHTPFSHLRGEANR